MQYAKVSALVVGFRLLECSRNTSFRIAQHCSNLDEAIVDS